jgi:integrase
MNVDEFVEKFRASDRTKQIYVGCIERFLEWAGDREITDELAQEYIDFLEKRGLKPNTLATVANALRAYWKVQKNVLEINAPHPSFSEPKYYEVEEIVKMLDCAKTPFEKTIVTLLFDTGARISEILNLKISDIDWEGGFVHVTLKGGHEGDYLVSAAGIAALKEWLSGRKSNSRRVFMDYDYNYAYYVLKKLAKKAEIQEFTPQRLRHSFAFFCKSKGVDIYDLQQLMQHRSINTTAILYGRSRPEDLRAKKPAWGSQ